MNFCIYKSFCEPKPKTFEQAYRCCNSCNSKTCTNRCKDDCKTCGLAADSKWVQEQKSKFERPQVESKPTVVSRKPKPADLKQDEAIAKAQADLRASELAKKEARKRRREARKGRAKAENSVLNNK